MEMMYKC